MYSRIINPLVCVKFCLISLTRIWTRGPLRLKSYKAPLLDLLNEESCKSGSPNRLEVMPPSSQTSSSLVRNAETFNKTSHHTLAALVFPTLILLRLSYVLNTKIPDPFIRLRIAFFPDCYLFTIHLVLITHRQGPFISIHHVRSPTPLSCASPSALSPCDFKTSIQTCIITPPSIILS